MQTVVTNRDCPTLTHHEAQDAIQRHLHRSESDARLIVDMLTDDETEQILRCADDEGAAVSIAGVIYGMPKSSSS